MRMARETGEWLVRPRRRSRSRSNVVLAVLLGLAIVIGGVLAGIVLYEFLWNLMLDELSKI